MDFFKNNKLIAVSRFDETGNSLDFAEVCAAAGIRLIEVITTRPNAYEIIKLLSENGDICVGAGTVLNLQSAEEAYNSGAKFIVSPHTDREIIEFTKSNKLVSIAGAFTSSEIVGAEKLGADYVKIFPASTVGPKYVRAIKEALPFANIMVTGGINKDNINDYISAGASLAGISTALTGNTGAFDKSTVSKNAGKFIEAIK